MAIDLSNYVRVGRYDLPEPTRTAAPSGNLLAQEASGVTYNWDTNTLFIVGDGGTSVTQVSLTGQLINTMTLAQGNSPQGTEFYDTESITYVGNGKFVFTEERDRQIVQFTYDAGTTLTRANAQTVDLGTNIGNVGLEGVSYDPLSGGFILVKEKTPLGIFQTTADFAHGTASNGSATTTDSINLFDPALLGLSDFSDVYALSSNPNIIGTSEQGNLLILSQESGKIVEVDRAGHILSSLTLQAPPTSSGIDLAAMTVEGMTMGPDGKIYLVSEEGGGDFDHPQLWVYAPAAATNSAPTALALSGAVTSILENTSTASRIKVADIVLTDDGLGNNVFTLTGADAAKFEVDASGLYIKAGTVLDYETKTSYSVTVNVDDASVGSSPDASTNYTLNVTNIVNEGGTGTHLIISEVAPWSSGNSPIGVDWFEITNTGSQAVNISGWKVDDDSASFGSAVALNGITSIAAGESVIFLEGNASNVAAFKALWFGNNVPAGLQVGTYSGSGIGLSTGGDQLNLYNASGALQAKVSFGASDPSAPWQTFDNAAGINNGTISTLSANGVNGAFTINPPTMGSEIGSPGSAGGVAAPINHAPTAIGLSSEITSIAEGTSTAARIKVADIVVTDDGLGTNNISVSGADAAFFEADSTGLYIKAGTVLDFETKANYAVTVNVDDTTLGSTPDASVNFSLNLTDVAEGPQPTVRITEVAPWASGNSPGAADWFEVTNTGAVAVNLTGWKMDDNSNAFGNAVAMSGVGSVAVGESVIFIEAPAGASASQIAALKAAFIDTWFGGHAPVNLQIGTYGGSGVGLSTGGDAVNLYNASGVLQANVSFGASPSGPYQTFDNTAGLNNAAITTLSAVGTNGAFNAVNDGLEVGSPGGDLVLANNGPLFTSPSAFTVDENQTAAAHLTATDADGDHLTYSISGGLDADLFTIDAATGVISFKAAPNFEAPADADHDGVYEIDVAVDDGHGLVGEDSIKVTVGNVNEGPLFSSPSAFAVDENQTAAAQLAATDVDGNHLTYSISGGLDADLFTIDAETGAISFKAAPDFEAPTDADHNGVYEIDVAVDDGHGLVGEDSIKVTVGNVNEGPLFTSPSSFAVGENQTAAAQLTATDPDGDNLTYTISGGLDADLFTIDAATGVITFKAAPDFDAPGDANHDNVYEIDVAVDDGHGLVGEDSIKVTVGNLNEAPALTGTQAVLANGTEDTNYIVSAASLLQGFSDADGDTLSVIGLTADHGVVVDNHDGTFTITPAANYSGAVALSYTVSDGNGGNLAASQGFALAAVNDAPSALALSNSTIAEQRPNNTLVGTLIPTDVDNASGFTYTLLDSAGGRFYLNSATGQVFVGNGSLLDYEASTHYTIDVQVKDAAGATYHQQLTINLTNVVENQSYAGTAAANVFTAPTEDNWTVDGKGGADVITTLSGNDTIFAGAGNDTVHTGGGNDVIYFTGAGGGFDAIDGGAGNDTILVNAVNTVIGLSSISGIETISSGGFAGVKIQGTTLDDVLDFSGTTLVGITSINGGTGNDTLTGSAGDDHIDGGLGTDILAGGAGNDTFVFTATGHTKNGSAFADHITDFALGDLIDLSTIDANGSIAGNQAFEFIGTAAFTGLGQLRIGMDNGHVAIFGNTAGNANAEFEIILDNNHAIQAADFIL